MKCFKIVSTFSICEKGKFNCTGDACPPFECDLGYMRCGELEICIPEIEVCDGYEQCPDGRDEANCGKYIGIFSCYLA